MVFGQPRQEELLEWLQQRPDRDDLVDLLRVDLTPTAVPTTRTLSI
jgi:hypothetical protein